MICGQYEKKINERLQDIMDLMLPLDTCLSC